MNSNRKYQQDKVKVSNRTDRRIGTAWDQDIRNKISKKTSSTDEVMERRETNTSIN